MKKLSIFIAALTVISAGSAFAAYDDAPSDNTKGKTVSSSGKAIGKLSAAVKLGAKGDRTGYAITTQHEKGTKTFGTSHDSTNVYATESLVGTAPADSDSSAFDGWTAM